MQHFRSNPPSRQIKPTPAYVPTFYPLPSGSGIRGNLSFADSVTPQQFTNGVLLAGLRRYLDRHPLIDEAMLGRLFASNPELLPEMRSGLLVPKHRRERIAAFIAREDGDA